MYESINNIIILIYSYHNILLPHIAVHGHKTAKSHAISKPLGNNSPNHTISEQKMELMTGCRYPQRLTSGRRQKAQPP